MTTNPSSSSSPYRNEEAALNERKESLETELRRLREQTTELETLRAREKELERELGAVEQKIGARERKRTLPMLDQVKVASPCNASWDEMLGDDRVRFCVSCEKNVYNLSAMPREDAERLLEERMAGGTLCIRFYQRADGTIMTEDCPVGVSKKRRKKLALAVAGAGAMAFAAATAWMRQSDCKGGGPVMGEMTEVTEPPPQPMIQGTASAIVAPPPADSVDVRGVGPAQHVMGAAVAPPRVSPPPAPKTR